jgi:hypothetical protein
MKNKELSRVGRVQVLLSTMTDKVNAIAAGNPFVLDQPDRDAHVVVQLRCLNRQIDEWLKGRV